MENAAERTIGRKCLQYRARIGETAGLDHDTAEVGQFAAFPLDDHAPKRLLQVGARDAAHTAIAEQHGFIGAGPYQHIVDTNGAEFVDNYRGTLALRCLQKTLEQGCLAGAEKAGDHGHGNTRPALTLEPSPEASGRSRREEFVQKSISSVYSPPV